MKAFGSLSLGLASGALALALGAAPAMATPTLTESFTSTVPDNSTDWSSSVSLSKFNPHLGTLVSVGISLSGTADGSLGVSDTQTFNDVGGPATSAVPDVNGYTTTGGHTHCTVSSTKCTMWTVMYPAEPPSTIPENTITSSLSATITLHVGTNIIVVLPLVSETDTLQAGPKYVPTQYPFSVVYTLTSAITKTQALALPYNGAAPAPNPIIATAPCNAPSALYAPCTVDGHTYDTGIYYSGLTATATNGATYTDPTDLALFTGSGNILLPIDAVGESSHTGGGNVSFLSETDAYADATVTYTYIPAPEPVTLALFGSGLVGGGLLRRRRLRTRS